MHDGNTAQVRLPCIHGELGCSACWISGGATTDRSKSTVGSHHVMQDESSRLRLGTTTHSAVQHSSYCAKQISSIHTTVQYCT